MSENRGIAAAVLGRNIGGSGHLRSISLTIADRAVFSKAVDRAVVALDILYNRTEDFWVVDRCVVERVSHSSPVLDYGRRRNPVMTAEI